MSTVLTTLVKHCGYQGHVLSACSFSTIPLSHIGPHGLLLINVQINTPFSCQHNQIQHMLQCVYSRESAQTACACRVEQDQAASGADDKHARIMAAAKAVALQRSGAPAQPESIQPLPSSRPGQLLQTECFTSGAQSVTTSRISCSKQEAAFAIYCLCHTCRLRIVKTSINEDRTCLHCLGAFQM